MYFHITKLFVLLIFLVPLISAQYEDDGYYPTTKWYMRAPKSISGLFRRLLGRRKNIRTGFQGTAIANGPYSSQPSSYYSSFFSNPFSSGSPNSGGSNYPGSQGQGSSGFSSNLWSPSLSSYTNVVGGMGSVPAAGSNYPTYSPPASGPGSGNPSNLDFHAVLDQFVRSAGLSPTGDQDTSASTIQSKGDSPVFSFKKLYSFPFYLSTDQQQPSDQGFNLQIPYMRKHIRRALHESPFKNPKFFVDKQSIQNWLLPKNWYHGQQALQQSASSIIPSTTNIQWPNGQESPILGGGHQRLYRGKPIEHNPRLVHQQGHMQASPSTIRSPVVPNSGVAPSLATSGPLKPGHLHQAQQSQPKAQIHPQSPISQSTSTSSSSSSSSSSTIVSAPSVSSSSVAPTNDQIQSQQQQQQQQQQGSSSSGQLTDSNILSSQAFITQYLQEHFAAANQKQLNGLNIKDDQEANESQYAPAYYYGSVANKGQQQPSQQGKQQVSGQDKGQPASGLPSSSSSSSSSTSLVSGDQSSPISSYQVSYSSGGYGASS